MRLILILLLSVNINAKPAVTKADYPACMTEEWIDDMIKFSNAKDEASFIAYIASNKCVIVREGLKVTADTSSSFFYKGIKFYTVREALTISETEL